MRRLLLTTLTTMAWLIASPSLQRPDSGWLEVGASPAAAQDYTGIMVREQGPTSANSVKTKSTKKSAKKSAKKSDKKSKPARVGSSYIVTSNQPGLYPIQPITPPPPPTITGTVTRAPEVAGYPNVPTVPIVPRGATGGAGVETSQDRVTRCTHQGALGGLPAGQQGGYIHNCAF